MLKRGSRYVCMFLIYLLTMPVLYSANVFAELNAGIYGSSKILGFRRSSSDVTIINATASLPGQMVESSQLKLITDPTRGFDCKYDNETFQTDCEVVIPGDLAPGPHLFEVQLFNLDLSEAGPKIPLTIYADNLAPDIHSFGLKRNGSDIEAEYHVSDRACEQCDPNICAGVERIEFLLDYEKVGEVLTAPAGAGPCMIPKNSTPLDIPPSPGTTTKTICIEAYDRLGQKSSLCDEIIMDFSPPQLLNASLWLGDFQIQYTRGEPIAGITLQAYISEDSGLNISSLVADFSSLNFRPEFSNAYKEIDMSPQNIALFNTECKNISEKLYLCTWDNLIIYLTEASTPTISISAYDNLGNLMDASYALPIVFDNTGPVITGARSGIADERGRFWVGAGNNTIFVDIDETGSGFYDKKLFLDFSSFGPQPFANQSTILFPQNCADGWTCIFDHINIINAHESGDVLTVNVIGDSCDDANNRVGGVTTFGFYYDNEPPQIIAVQNSSICPTAPDSIEIIVNASELHSGGVKATFSAPNISTASFPQTVDCEETSATGVWTCRILIDRLVTLYADGEIDLTLEDRAGNKQTTTLHQEVCEAAPGVPPNVLRLDVDPSTYRPSQGIDRKIASHIPYPFFYTLNIRKSGGEVQDMKIDSCELSDGSVSDMYIVTGGEFDSPLIRTSISLDPEAIMPEEDELLESVDMTCNFSLIIRSGRKVYQLPETDTVTFTIPLYNLPLGYIPDAINDDIEDINDEISDLEDTIDDLETTNDILGTICTLGQLLTQLIVTAQAVKAVLFAVGLPWYWGESWFPSVCQGIDTASNWILRWGFNPFLATTFDPNIIYTSGIWLRILCTYYTCELAETSNFIESFTYTGTARGNSFTYSYKDDSEQSKPSGAADVLALDPFGSLFTDYDYSVYKSLDVSYSVGCIPGILYNYKKERQIKCLYRKCLRDRAAAGFSTAECDEIYKIRECVYVESAALKGIGFSEFAMWMQGIGEYALKYAGNYAAIELLIHGMECTWLQPGKPHTYCDPYPSPMTLACGLGLATAAWLDVGDMYRMFKDIDFNKFERQLQQPDFCSE